MLGFGQLSLCLAAILYVLLELGIVGLSFLNDYFFGLPRLQLKRVLLLLKFNEV